MNTSSFLSLLAPPRPVRRLVVRLPAWRGLGGWFTGPGSTFLNFVLPAGLVAICAWGVWHYGKFAITGRKEPPPGVPPAWKAVG